jgi:hypothetical protein
MNMNERKNNQKPLTPHEILMQKKRWEMEELEKELDEAFKKMEKLIPPLEDGEIIISKEMHRDRISNSDGPKTIYYEEYNDTFICIVDDGKGGTYRVTRSLSPRGKGEVVKEKLK